MRSTISRRYPSASSLSYPKPVAREYFLSMDAGGISPASPPYAVPPFARRYSFSRSTVFSIVFFLERLMPEGKISPSFMVITGRMPRREPAMPATRPILPPA